MLYCIHTEKKISEYDKPSNQFEEAPDTILASTIQKTRMGELEFHGGIPALRSQALLAEYFDFNIHVQFALCCIPIAIMAELKDNLQALGLEHNKVGVFMQGVDSNSLLLAANPRVIYALSWLDITQMPLVIEVPPGMLCSIRDASANPVGGISLASKPQGGGKYLLVGPDWQGSVDEADYTAVLFSNSYGNGLTIRGFLDVDSSENILRGMAQSLKIYPLDDLPQRASLYNLSGVKFSTLPTLEPATVDKVSRVIHCEHDNVLDQETHLLFEQIGLKKNQPFLRDMAKQQLLAEAFSVACAHAKTKLYCTKTKSRNLYQNSAWFTFSDDGFLYMHLYKTCNSNKPIAPCSLPSAKLTVGQQLKTLSAMTFTDANNRHLIGGMHYRLRISARICMEPAWSITLYDAQHCSMLITQQAKPVLCGANTELKKNSDNSIDLFFSPLPPVGREANWIQTNGGEVWFAIFRVVTAQGNWQSKRGLLADIEIMQD